jgi:hypothetical protein
VISHFRGKAPKLGFAQKVGNTSAKGAQYESQGQAPNNVRRVAPGKSALIREALKERNNLVDISHFQCSLQNHSCNQGRRVPLRFTLAPGFHIARLWRWHWRLCAKPSRSAA